MEAKRIAAETAVEYLEDGMVVGLGSGTTAYWAIQKMGERVRTGLKIKAIASSKKSENLAKEQGIELILFSELEFIDITIDGADEVDPDMNLIKGGGGSLLREKIIAAASKRLIIIVDESKLVERLGRFALPVEVIPFGSEITLKTLHNMDCTPKLRLFENNPYLTDNGNYIVDCDFGLINHPEDLHNRIKLLLGVVETGLFIHMAKQVIIGCKDGTVKKRG